MWRLCYADGSANLVRLADDGEFEYLPVTPAESSSGSYSGGDPVRARLSPGDPRIAAIRAEVERLAADTPRHIAQRTMGSGAFTIEAEGIEQRFMVEPAAVRGLDQLIRSLRRAC